MRNNRTKRFSRALHSSGIQVQIPESWEELPRLPIEAHEEKYIQILENNGIPARLPVPLVSRYSKARRWSAEELEACIEAHSRGTPIAIMSAALNRNPQDIIYRLLDVCGEAGIPFNQIGLKSSAKWDDVKLTAARQLFEAGLTAWRIAAVFGVDFEGVEKTLYMGRDGYGHTKKNPFAVCTDHKQIVNQAALTYIAPPSAALDAFAGEGRFSESISNAFPDAHLVCIEQEKNTFQTGITRCAWRANVTWHNEDNLVTMTALVKTNKKFDLIDLDPFVSCREQIDLTWPLLQDHAYLFLTFGGEYRRSFITTNRKAIARRYGFWDDSISNQEYLEIVPQFFLGWVAREAALHGFTFTPLYCVRYANNCRFWLEVTAQDDKACLEWLSAHVTNDRDGFRWHDLAIPRFAQVRNVTPMFSDKTVFPEMQSSRKQRKSKTNLQMDLGI